MKNLEINQKLTEKINERICKIAKRINEAMSEYNVARTFKICDCSLDTRENNQFEFEEILRDIYSIGEMFLFKENLFEVFFELEKAEKEYGDILNGKYVFLRGHNPHKEKYNLYTGGFEEMEDVIWRKHLPFDTVEKLVKEDEKIDLQDLKKEVWKMVNGFFED